MTALVPGAMLGSYTIGQELGRGAMGSVFEGVHRVTGVRRAIKVVRADLAASSEYRERFVREASIATQLRHPNIVETYDPIVDGSLLALPMEFLHGRPLSAYFQERTRLELREIVSLVLPVGAALAAIHARGYVHRDVKPHNVMLVESAGGLEPKLLDFGTARDVLGLQRTTLTGEIVGSPAYMAPEQALDGAVDERTDLYALSVLFYELMALRHCFHDKKNLQAMLMATMYEDPIAAVHQRHPSQGCVPIEYSYFIKKGMKKKPEARYQSAQEMIHELEMVMDGCVSVQCPSTLLKRTNHGMERILDRRPVLMTAVFYAGAALVLTLAVLGAWDLVAG